MKQRMAFSALEQQFAQTLFFAILLYIRPAQAVAQGSGCELKHLYTDLANSRLFAAKGASAAIYASFATLPQHP